MSMSENTKLAINGGTPAISSPLPAGGHGRELLGKEEEENVLQVARSRRFQRYEHHYKESFAGRLELELEQYLGVKHVILTISGSFAAKACFLAAGIGPGDEVIVPAFSWQTIPGAIVEAGALPVVAQCDETFTMDPKDVERLITPRTKAIVPTHIQGLPSNMDALLEIAKKHNLQVIEDVCQASGGSYKGRRHGSLGDSAFFSMNCMKLMAAGTAGFLATNRDDVYLHAASYLGMHFFPEHKSHLNGKTVFVPPTYAVMTELTAAVAYAQFKKLEGQLQKLRAVRDAIAAETAGCKTFQRAPSNDPDGECGMSFSMYFKNPEDTHRFMEAVRAEGVPMATSVDYYQFYAPAEFACWVVDGAPVMETRAAWAKFWPFFMNKQPMHPKNNPWAGLDVDYSHVMDKTLEVWRHVGIVRINPMMTVEHGRQIGAAIRKVDAAMAR